MTPPRTDLLDEVSREMTRVGDIHRRLKVDEIPDEQRAEALRGLTGHLSNSDNLLDSRLLHIAVEALLWVERNRSEARIYDLSERRPAA